MMLVVKGRLSREARLTFLLNKLLHQTKPFR